MQQAIPKEHLLCHEIQYGSEEYRQTIELRNEILRRPLGLVVTEEQMRAEAGDIHLACYFESRLVACLILTPRTQGEVQMRQFAVAADCQRCGVGRVLLQFAEQRALQGGFSLLTMHARESAVPFYEKYGYARIGERYILVSIPHFNMEKALTPATPTEPNRAFP